ncbi:acetoacetyl-CoA reductase/3-oxoacyl-[acyl-carrier protein] reductase [Pedobacter cryoconitis]|uniref:Acetoacetyl-CoA reductase/3-oxoacyl-[acyl-carrier protein] reductase n=1 Tax=Pedobacter cryoconitis TaxID=188932 RepID=A0A7W9DKX6_9SPHI|nr:SDR family NAD(P)-dependent oxidoreductase [Pedobacter cryoconitis]MBB5622329.1 acetoacetyl-CoA reductase/3-oxoacyl-[acyl-carrier protein] reductase [Pedobacter cryoconitis]
MIIITGASRGIGFFLLDKFIALKQDVIGLYNNSIPDVHAEYMRKVDISKPDEVQAFAESIKDSLDKVILINCAGANYSAFAHKADPLKWANLININLIGTFNVINVFLTGMREQGYGRIINLSSVVAQKGIPGTSAYAASKAGLWGMTKAISAENAGKGITINNLNLGYFQIGMIDEVPVNMQEAIKGNIPVNKFGSPDEILKAVQYLISTDYVTGTSLDINGGLF